MTLEITLDGIVYEFESLTGVNQKLSYMHRGRIQKKSSEELPAKNLDVLLKRQNPQNAGPLAEHFIENAIVVEERINRYKKEKGIERIEGFPTVFFTGDIGHNRGVGIVTEKVGDCDLEEKLKEDGIAHIDKALGMYLKLLDLIEILHYCNIVHADITPDNIRVSNDLEKVFLIDFGIAREQNKPITQFYNGTPYVPECSIPPDREGKYSTRENLFLNDDYLLPGITKETIADSGIDVAMATNVIYKAVTGSIYKGKEGDIEKNPLFGQLPVNKGIVEEVVGLLNDGFSQIADNYKGVNELREKVKNIREKLQEQDTAQKLKTFYDYKKDEKTYPIHTLNENSGYEQLERTLDLCARVNNEVDPKPRAGQALEAFNKKTWSGYLEASANWGEFLEGYKKGSIDRIPTGEYTAFNDLLQHLQTVSEIIAKKNDLFWSPKKSAVDVHLRMTKKKVSDIAAFSSFLEFERTYQPEVAKLHTARKTANESLTSAISRYTKLPAVPDEITSKIAVKPTDIDAVIEEFENAKKTLSESNQQAIYCSGLVMEEKKKIGEQTIHEDELKKIINEKLEAYGKDTFAGYLPDNFLPAGKRIVADVENRCTQIVNELTVLRDYILFENEYQPQAVLSNKARKDASDRLAKAVGLSTSPQDISGEITEEITISPADINVVIEEFEKAKEAIEKSATLSAHCNKLVNEEKERIKQKIHGSDIQKIITARLDGYGADTLTAVTPPNEIYRKLKTPPENICDALIERLTMLKEYIPFEKEYVDKKQVFEQKCTEVTQLVQEAWKRVHETGTIDDKLKDAEGAVTKIAAAKTAVDDALRVAGECNGQYTDLIGAVNDKKKEIHEQGVLLSAVESRLGQLEAGIEAAVKKAEYLQGLGLDTQITTIGHEQKRLSSESTFWTLLIEARDLRASYGKEDDVQRIAMQIVKQQKLAKEFTPAPQGTGSVHDAVAAVLAQKQAERERYAQQINGTIDRLTAEEKMISNYYRYASREQTVPQLIDGNLRYPQSAASIPKTFPNRKTLKDVIEAYREYVSEVEIYRTRLDGEKRDNLEPYRAKTDELLVKIKEQLRTLEETNKQWLRRKVLRFVGYTTAGVIGAGSVWALVSYGSFGTFGIQPNPAVDAGVESAIAGTYDAGIKQPVISAPDAGAIATLYVQPKSNDAGAGKPDTGIEAALEALHTLPEIVIDVPRPPTPQRVPPVRLTPPPAVPKQPALPASGYEWRTPYETKKGD